MKFAKKMMLVPAGRAAAEIETMSALDNEMASVLKNNQLTPNEKMNIYNQILNKNIITETRLKQKMSKKPKKEETVSAVKIEENAIPVEVNEVDEDDLFYDTLSIDEEDQSAMSVDATIPKVFLKKEKIDKKKAKKKLQLNTSKSFCVDKWCQFGKLRTRVPVNYAELSFKSPINKKNDPDYGEPNKKKRKRN
jgi:hypothetical protein